MNSQRLACVGIDVSKGRLDVAIGTEKEVEGYANDSSGHEALAARMLDV